MALESIAFVFGGIFLLIGIVGGGFEIRELKLPQVSTPVRLICFAFGVIFLLIPVGIHAVRQLPGDSDYGDPKPVGFVASPPTSGAGKETGAETDAALQSRFQGVTGTVQFHWHIGPQTYEAALSTSGTSGLLRVSFYDPTIGQNVSVDQDVSLAQRADGAFWIGANPRYAGTTILHQSYAPDILRLVQTTTGWQVVDVCDAAGWCAPIKHSH